MKAINMSRVVLGGIVAGIVQFVLEGIINGLLLNEDWQNWKERAARVTALPFRHTSMAYWLAESMVLGFVGVWIYAGIRPRLGPGPKTAVCAGLTLWASSCLGIFLNNQALGIMPLKIGLTNTIGGIFVVVFSVLAGAYLYKERR